MSLHTTLWLSISVIVLLALAGHLARLRKVGQDLLEWKLIGPYTCEYALYKGMDQNLANANTLMFCWNEIITAAMLGGEPVKYARGDKVWTDVGTGR